MRPATCGGTNFSEDVLNTKYADVSGIFVVRKGDSRKKSFETDFKSQSMCRCSLTQVFTSFALKP